MRGVAILENDGFSGMYVVRIRLGRGQEELEAALLRLNAAAARSMSPSDDAP